jgi:hypothetical protein
MESQMLSAATHDPFQLSGRVDFAVGRVATPKKGVSWKP